MSENTEATPPIKPVLKPSLNSSEQINELMEALAKAQADFPTIPKDSTVEVKSKDGRKLYEYKYADLTTIIDCTRPSLTKNGISFTQDYTKHPALGVGIHTILFHSSGQWIKTGFVPCQIQSMDMKQIAGQFTYGKRISLTAALGVSGDEDLDAADNDAQKGNSTQKKNKNDRPVADSEENQRLLNQQADKRRPGDRFDHLRTDTPKTKLDELLALKAEKKIPDSAMPDMIKKAIGFDKKAKALTDEQIDKVIAYLKLLSGGSNEG